MHGSIWDPKATLVGLVGMAGEDFFVGRRFWNAGWVGGTG